MISRVKKGRVFFLLSLIVFLAFFIFPQQSKASTTNIAQSIINSGMKYIGTPYQYGADPNSTTAFDCSSYTSRIFLENGIRLPRTSEQQSNLGYEIPLKEAQIGDLVFFKFPNSASIDHVGVYLGDMKMLNATVSKGVKITDISTYYWTSIFVKAKRVIPDTYQVVSSDSLWKISVKTNVSISQLQTWNGINADMIMVGQILFIANPDLTISVANTPKVNSYIVQPGDTLWIISQKTGISIENVKLWNQLNSDAIYIGQLLFLEPPFTYYTVVSGDSLWKISNITGVNIDGIKAANNLTSDYLDIGQILIIPKQG